MMHSDQILATVDMIQKENLDVRAVTMGIDLMDCRSQNPVQTCAKIKEKICLYAGRLVPVCEQISKKYGIAVVNKRIAVTPIAYVGAGFSKQDFVAIARTLDEAASEVGVDFLGGFSANVENGTSKSAATLMAAMPEAIAETAKICASVNVGSSKYGINMDAVAIMGGVIKQLAEDSADQGGFGAARLVVFCNQPEANPFMAGAIHGPGQHEVVINVGVSGPGVVARALERKLAESDTTPGLHELAEEIKQTAFRVTRCGELIGRRVSSVLGVPFGIVDVSLAPTPKVGDSVGEILKIMGVDAIGAPGSTAIIALLNDAVKKGGTFASQNAGGLSGAFIPVCEDAELAEAVKNNTLPLEKLEAMTAVCSVGLDMVAVPGSVDAVTIGALIADEMAIGMINSKTTAVRIIPVPGKKAGEFVSFGGLFGESALLEVRNTGKSARFMAFGGKIPAPINSLKN
jgi:uncharacterized protein (UPF0210 family)